MNMHKRELTNFKSAFDSVLTIPPAFSLKVCDRLVSHSDVNHLQGSVPKEPMDENWPITDQSEDNFDGYGP